VWVLVLVWVWPVELSVAAVASEPDAETWADLPSWEIVVDLAARSVLRDRHSPDSRLPWDLDSEVLTCRCSNLVVETSRATSRVVAV
jgi:hypothetical protein